jgi:mannosylglycerate hydrolase
MADLSPKKTGIVVSHTHWDRAWYLPFEQFRHRMVRMVDRLITLLHENPDFHSFTLDGQTILLEDYLQIKPYNEKVIARMISSGKMIVGPWYVLPDMFLVSGESVVRNLQIGLQTARKYGSAMQEGYVPDPFGHFAQLPQILRQFGMDSFIFMRGLEESDKSNGGAIFDWESPDGSRVLTTYLAEGYFNGAALGFPEQFGRFDGLIPDAQLAKDRLKEAISKLESLQKESTFLINNGFDHMPEQPELPQLLRVVNSNGSNVEYRHGTFRDFFDGVRREQKQHHVVRGDLLGNVDHPILSSVFSTRIYLKQQNHLAQSQLERYVEPLLLLGSRTAPNPDPSDFLQYNWKLLMQNHPHDDICGCSTDGVHEDDEVRFRQVTELNQSLMVEQLESMLRAGVVPPVESADNHSDVFVFNPHPWPVKARISARILFKNARHEEGERQPERVLRALDADGSPLALTVNYSHPHTIRNNFLETSWGRRYDVTFDIDLPATGYKMVHIYELPETPDVSAEHATTDLRDILETLPASLENAHTIVSGSTELRAWNTSYAVHLRSTGIRFRDFVRFEYQHDNGDTYTFGPVPGEGVHWAKITAVQVHPHRNDTILLRHELTVPEALYSPRQTTLAITTQLTLTPAGGVALHIDYENTAKDGRLRLVLPAGFTTDAAWADGHFRIAERRRKPVRTPESAPERYKAYPGELDYPTMHMNDFVVLRSPDYQSWFASRGLHEFELLEEEDMTWVALTINRSVGLLSTGNGRIRRCQAGPSLPVPGAQCLRPISVQVAFGCIAGDDLLAAVRPAREFAHPVWAREMPWLAHLKQGSKVSRTDTMLEIDDPAVALSSLRLHPDGITTVLRIYNQSSETRRAGIHIHLPAEHYTETDLHENWDPSHAQVVPGDRIIGVTLGPHQIKTILLRVKNP